MTHAGKTTATTEIRAYSLRSATSAPAPTAPHCRLKASVSPFLQKEDLCIWPIEQL